MWSRLNTIRYLVCFVASVLVSLCAVVMIIGDSTQQLWLIPIALFTVGLIHWVYSQIKKHPERFRGA